jgi:hypothetical protein
MSRPETWVTGRTVEASGSYSWLVDEMERAGHRPKLANPLEAKRRMALTKKTEQAGCKRAGDPALKRHSAGGVDSTERVARLVAAGQTLVIGRGDTAVRGVVAKIKNTRTVVVSIQALGISAAIDLDSDGITLAD